VSIEAFIVRRASTLAGVACVVGRGIACHVKRIERQRGAPEIDRVSTPDAAGGHDQLTFASENPAARTSLNDRGRYVCSID
jgi:hypothetical protein